MTPPRWAWLLATLAAVCALYGATPATPDAEAFPNGQPAAAEVAPINAGVSCSGLQGQLANRAAAAYNTMALHAGKTLPINGCSSAVRLCGVPSDFPPPVYGTQHYFWGAYLAGVGNLAARPCTSNHGGGVAIDGNALTQSVIRSNGAKFGWRKIEAFSEPWHFNYVGGFTRPDPGPSLTYPVLRRGSGGPGQHHYVARSQELGRKHGCSIEVDGEAGPKWERCMESIQAAHGAKVDGLVGEQTWKILRGKPVKDPEPPKPKPTPKPTGPVTGIDVSQHQPVVTWSKVADTHEFAAIKISEGQDYKDPAATQGRYDAIRKAGLVRGTYHYLRPRSDRSGAVEAAFYVAAMRAIGQGRGDLRPVVDIEETTLSPTGTCGYLRSFTRHVREQVGAAPIVYTGPSFANTNLAGCGEWLGKLPLWVAHYGVAKPIVPGPWSGYEIHQFTSSGHVAGIPGEVDLNRVPGGRKVLEGLVDKPASAKPASVNAITGGLRAPEHGVARSRAERRRLTERGRDVACGRRQRNAHGEPCKTPVREAVPAE